MLNSKYRRLESSPVAASPPDRHPARFWGSSPALEKARRLHNLIAGHPEPPWAFKGGPAACRLFAASRQCRRRSLKCCRATQTPLPLAAPPQIPQPLGRQRPQHVEPGAHPEGAGLAALPAAPPGPAQRRAQPARGGGPRGSGGGRRWRQGPALGSRRPLPPPRHLPLLNLVLQAGGDQPRGVRAARLDQHRRRPAQLRGAEQLPGGRQGKLQQGCCDPRPVQAGPRPTGAASLPPCLQFCKAKVSCPIPADLLPEQAAAAGQRYVSKLSESHDAACPWRTGSSSLSLLQFPPLTAVSTPAGALPTPPPPACGPNKRCCTAGMRCIRCFVVASLDAVPLVPPGLPAGGGAPRL